MVADRSWARCSPILRFGQAIRKLARFGGCIVRTFVLFSTSQGERTYGAPPHQRRSASHLTPTPSLRKTSLAPAIGVFRVCARRGMDPHAHRQRAAACVDVVLYFALRATASPGDSQQTVPQGLSGCGPSLRSEGRLVVAGWRRRCCDRVLSMKYACVAVLGTAISSWCRVTQAAFRTAPACSRPR